MCMYTNHAQRKREIHLIIHANAYHEGRACYAGLGLKRCAIIKQLDWRAVVLCQIALESADEEHSPIHGRKLQRLFGPHTRWPDETLANSWRVVKTRQFAWNEWMNEYNTARFSRYRRLCYCNATKYWPLLF